METDSRKFTILSFLILAGIFSYVLYLVATELANVFRFGGSDVLLGQPWVVVGGSFSALVGLVAFGVLASNAKALDFTDDVFSEIKKTTWPTGKETASSTLVVSVMVIVAALMFLFMDMIWKNLFDFLL